MLIRVRGHVDGVKEYLEGGQKQGRDFERDELDERVILAGDLDITNEIIQSMDTDAERYLTVTLSFREDDINDRVLREIVDAFERFTFSAFRPEEYCFYAEAHLPRIKAYANRKTGERVMRKPHIHIVIPKHNLLNGQKLDPFAMVKHQERYIDAFQEHINQEYGLASPKAHRRVEITDASEIISRYKGDVFEGQNRELKQAILKRVIDGGIAQYADFQRLLEGCGERRTRNAGRQGEYENLKVPGAAKGVNLKEYVFSREFIELGPDEKASVLAGRIEERYETAGAARTTPAALLATLAEWHETRAKEVKYFNGGNLKAYPFYQSAGPDERRRLLEERENRFYQRSEGDLTHERLAGQRSGIERIGGNGIDARLARASPRARGFPAPPESGRARYEPQQQWHIGLDELAGRLDREFDPDGFGPGAPTEARNSMRGVPGSRMDGDGSRGFGILPGHAHDHVAHVGAESDDPLRWAGARDRAVAGTGDVAKDSTFIARVEAYYAAFEAAGMPERDRMIADTARKFHVAEFGLKGQQGASADPFRRQGVAEHTKIPHIDQVPVARPSGRTSRRLSARPRAATGREADSVRDQLARDLAQRREGVAGGKLMEFQQIKLDLDAARLLAALSQSHGLIPEKYIVTKGRDGSDRIVCGSRNLNVSDFLTKEMHLSWIDAAKILRTTYAEQVGHAQWASPSRDPERSLWSDFQAYRAATIEHERAIWGAQKDSERVRRADIRTAFYAERSRIENDPSRSRSEKRAALSLARMAKVESESGLRKVIAAEREALKHVPRPRIGEHYRDYLHERARDGSARALSELRRMQAREPEPRVGVATVRPRNTNAPVNEVIYRGPIITHDIGRNGVVTYKRDGVGFLSDEGRSLRVWTADDQAIETALRLAITKFGASVELSGPEAFQLDAARVAAEQGVNVRFASDDLNRVMDDRRAELANERASQQQEERARTDEARRTAVAAVQRVLDRERNGSEKPLADGQERGDREPDAPDTSIER